MLLPEMVCEIYAYRAKNNKQQLWLLKEKSSDEPTEKKNHLDFQRKRFLH